MGRTQLSAFIRPYNKTECNGFERPPGHLQEFDLQGLNQHIPEFLKDWIREKGKEQYLIGYTFFYWKSHKRIFIGWIITDYEHNHLKTVYARDTAKVISAIDECRKYVCN